MCPLSRNIKIVFTALWLLILILAWGINPNMARADYPCGTGAAVPAFLTEGVDPNLLVIIDNSASMLDLAYVDDASTCYEGPDPATGDQAYSNTTTYAGYFDPDMWYYTNTGLHPDTGGWQMNYFYPTTINYCPTYGVLTGNDGTDDFVCLGNIYDYTLPAVTAMYPGIDANGMINGELVAFDYLFATGNFLNWLAASKIDIQKEILTGGKYNTASRRWAMEARGCSGRRFVKEVALEDSIGTTYYLSFGVTPPNEGTYDEWAPDTVYTNGDIVSDGGSTEYYIAYIPWDGVDYNETSLSTAASVTEDTSINWTPRFWKAGQYYRRGDIVSDPNNLNTIDEGQLYIATNYATSTGTSFATDSGVSWERYDLTHIDIFTAGTTQFNNSACQDAIDALGSTDTAILGQLKKDIDDCLDYNRNQNQGDTADSNAAFNHSIHNCWYETKHGTWPPGAGPVQSIKPACEAIYANGIQPWEITPDDSGYVCYGIHTGDASTDSGYVGRCWEPSPADCTWKCFKPNGDEVVGPTSLEECLTEGHNYDWEPVDAVGDPCTAANWDPDPTGYSDQDDCIEQALIDFCGDAEIPEVIDPSDQVGSATGDTETLWNIPAMLIDSGVVAQMGQPIITLQGNIYNSDATYTPQGLIQEFDDDIRMGAMTFNDNGSLSECAASDPYILYDCHASNRDGGKVIEEIGQSTGHTINLVDAINDIKATSWTPLAEAMFNAIGYYAQDINFRLDSADFSTGTDPVLAYCQDNNILIITEGASTADQNSTMTSWAAGSGNNDTDANDANPDCGILDGSTLLDDLTYYAYNNDTIMGTMPDVDGVDQDKQNISTHIVVAGNLRDDGTTDECNPATLLNNAANQSGTALYSASDPSVLEDTLREAFSAIRAGAAAGSAASVISASRGGEGATYQAIFFPTVELDGGGSVDWTGEVHALLVDSEGELYEDSDGDRTLDTTADNRVIFFFDENENKTKVCRNGTVSNSVCSGTEIDLEDVKYLWSAAQWLSQIPPVNDADNSVDITFNRAQVPSPYATASNYISTSKKRYIFTWNDLDNDGIVDDAELLNFDEDTDWAGLTVNSTNPAGAGYRAPVPYDFGVSGADAAQTNAEVDKIVNWVRGLDQTGMRERYMPYAFGGGTESDIYWRLGDVIHSTPISVAAPGEGFHLLYRDSTYAEFVSVYKNRRHVIYYGGNDGMLHAVNGGFYDETQKKFCKTSTCVSESAAPDLGAELWAYVPYNLVGHLGCLTKPFYTNMHKYFVDQRVRVFDMRIFPSDAIHPQGWGTVMVAAMRFGGAKIYPGTLDLNGDTVAEYPADTREFTSAYMVFDITDPENPPVLLAEMTRTTSGTWAEMGYTTPIPTAVVFKTGSGTSNPSWDWYLVFGSGPTELDGTSTQDAKIAVLPMDWLTGSTKRPFRIPDQVPDAGTNQGGVFTITGSVFASDLVTVDFEIDADYMSDAVYFGTLSGDWYDASTNPDGWGGGVYRLVSRSIDSNGDQVVIEPSSWSLHHLINTEQPVTASPSVGTDGKNYWVYFGTGRFLASNDKLDPEVQSYYGIKEPMTFATSGGICGGTLTWDTVEKTGSGSDPGSLGLTDVSLIDVNSDSTLSGSGIPSGVTTFDELVDHIAGTGTGCEGTPDHGTDGWRKDFQLDKERNIGQATLLGGLLTFTTYQPSTDQCLAEGVSYLYGVYYQTGTAYSQGVFLSAENPEGIDAGTDTVIEQVALGRGLATTPNLHVGKHEGSKAFVQTSTGEIVEVPQPNLPLGDYKTGRISWGQVK